VLWAWGGSEGLELDPQDLMGSLPGGRGREHLSYGVAGTKARIHTDTHTPSSFHQLESKHFPKAPRPGPLTSDKASVWPGLRS
jgi:hypothetical protein